MATGAFRAQHRNDSRRDSNKCGKDMKAEHGQELRGVRRNIDSP